MIKFRYIYNKALVKRTVLAFISLVIISTGPGGKIFALDTTFYQNNEILFYNPDQGSNTCSDSGTGTVNDSGGNSGTDTTTAPTVTPTSAATAGTVGSYKNPVYGHEAPDPTVIVGDDGLFHVYATGNVHLTSKDMSSWKNVGGWGVKGVPSSVTARWAPDVVKMGNKYIFLFASGAGSGSIHYAVGDHAGGPFNYKGKLSLAQAGKQNIDPQVFIDDNGDAWLFYGTLQVNAVKVQFKNGTLSKVGSEKKNVMNISPYPSGYAVEGWWVTKHDGWYYMFYSYGRYPLDGINPPYSVRVSRSRTVDGPYTPYKTHDILEGSSSTIQRPGHNSIVTDSAGNDWIVYHGYAKSTGNHRVLNIDPIIYKDGWPVINDGKGPSATKQPGTVGGGADPATPVVQPDSTPVVDDSQTTSSGNCVCQESTSSSSLTGSDNEQKIFNYFISKGLSPKQTAAIFGNMMQESSLDPENTQTGYTPDRTKNPTEVSSKPNDKGVLVQGGWGLIQWTPAAKVLKAQTDAGVSGNIWDLSTQLDIVWGHLNGHPKITTGQFDLTHFKTIDSIEEALLYYEKHIEGAGDPQLGKRIDYANTAYGDYLERSNDGTPVVAVSDSTSDSTCTSNLPSDEDPDVTPTTPTPSNPTPNTPGIGIGKGKFTDSGSVKNYKMVLNNAIIMDRLYQKKLYKDYVCASIVSRIWRNSTVGWGNWPTNGGTANPVGMYKVLNGTSKFHANRKPKVGSILIYAGGSKSSSYKGDGHTVIYLGSNTILNDGWITDANDAEGWGGGYNGWVDPNDIGWTTSMGNETSIKKDVASIRNVDYLLNN